ncbi:MAG: hypothetical protein O7E57_04125 [Gammaproteobacteria bacterium]|nr:hypothetical protein [Gammaproteobacteria bacterium]
MSIPISLHLNHDGDPGVEAWSAAYPGFVTWAEDRTKVSGLRDRIAWYKSWRLAHLLPIVNEPVGHQTRTSPVEVHDNWRRFLPGTRRETLSFLSTLKASSDLLRSSCTDHGYGMESWTVGKTLRRLVSHEPRIATVYGERSK